MIRRVIRIFGGWLAGCFSLFKIKDETGLHRQREAFLQMSLSLLFSKRRLRSGRYPFRFRLMRTDHGNFVVRRSPADLVESGNLKDPPLACQLGTAPSNII